MTFRKQKECGRKSLEADATELVKTADRWDSVWCSELENVWLAEDSAIVDRN
jgi:hypothetical protein